MTPFLLTIPFITGVLNRYWRGEANISRWVWYWFMTSLAVMIYLMNHANSARSDGVEVACCWLLFLLGYALAPWQAMFCSITGQPPSRKDSWPWQWMQVVSGVGESLAAYGESYWREFGVIYGSVRACLMLPGIFALCWFYHSDYPLYGLTLLGMGLVYFCAGKVASHEDSTNIAVALAEFTIGWMIGCYFLICGQL